MPDISVPVSKLLLDELNPRHRAVTTQDAALAEVIRRAPIKLLNLARDIAMNGLSPIDRPIVVKSDDGKKYIVLTSGGSAAPKAGPTRSTRSKYISPDGSTFARN